MTYKEKIVTLEKYLLDPKKAVDDDISYFGSLHDILRIQNEKRYNELANEVFDLFWGVVNLFIEPFEIERYHVLAKIKGKGFKIIHTDYLDKDLNLLTDRVDEKTLLELKELVYDKNEFELQQQFKYYYRIDKILGFDLKNWVLTSPNVLIIDRRDYLGNGFHSNLGYFLDERYNIYKRLKEYTDLDNISVGQHLGVTVSKRIEGDTLFAKMCTTYNQINFHQKNEKNFCRYMDELQKKHNYHREERLHSIDDSQKWYENLVNKHYLKGDFESFDAFVNNMKPLNKLRWVKSPPKGQGVAKSALIEFLELLNYPTTKSFNSSSKEDITANRKNMRSKVKLYFDIDLASSNFDKPESASYDELKSILR